MKKTILSGAFALAIALGANAQSAMDAYSLMPVQLRGTARFVAMGGAFTSLGGDLSCMNQNPAGLGIYRRSEIGLTFDVSIRSNTATTSAEKTSTDFTKAIFDNFGYVGTSRLNGALRTFTWGVSYNRNAEFERRFQGYNYPANGSLTDYIASYTQGTNSDDLVFGTGFNPYLDSNSDWLSILAFNSYMISNTTDNERYTGLSGINSRGDAAYDVLEHGYSDEYNIDFAGNVMDVLYWGLGVGIVDMNYTRQVLYSESIENAVVYDTRNDRLAIGNAGFTLDNYKAVSGTGANLKFGVILRPVDALRIGVAVHTPTWMHLTSNGDAAVSYDYSNEDFYNYRTSSSPERTDPFEYSWRLTTPWRVMAGVSATIGRRAIISVDYEHVAYPNASMKYQAYGRWGSSYVSDEFQNANIKDYFKGADILRAGVELRLSSHVSARAGYWWQSTNVRNAAADGYLDISTAGTDPSYSFDRDTQNICLGLGYRYKSWYADLTYQHTIANSTFHAYTPYLDNIATPEAKVCAKHNNIVISTGFKF